MTPTAGAAPCCGALHTHAGLEADAAAIARQVIAGLSADDRPVLVDSAGCGAAMKHYGRLLGTPEAQAFAERVFDVHEWLADRLDVLLDSRADAEPLELTVAVQDPCHLRHAQRSHEAVPVVLGPFVQELVTLDDDGLCCGAGGAYSMLEPELATAIRARKKRSGASVVASANPGCSLHLAAAGLDVRHPLELVAQALDARQSTSP
ncbi:MAG: (Fe-S)-binding protein [Acidimicrobiia bacterium]|nr:(Fe-S)-binding protein [Acidimicrobiia bacterium]